MGRRPAGLPLRALASAMAFVLAMHPSLSLACTGVYLGSDTTAAGEVIYGRSEVVSNISLKRFGVEPASSGITWWSTENGPEQDPQVNFTYTFAGPTYRYTYVRDLSSDHHGSTRAYSQAGVNEKGVSVDATVSIVCNDAVLAADPLVANGIGEFNVADILLAQSATAREGVELLGILIDSYGSQGCNQLWIADAHETWVFNQLAGHQWVAVQAPSDVVAVNPNMGSLRHLVDLANNDTCLHSDGLVQIPEAAGTLTLDETGALDVGASYGLESESHGAYSRYVQGHEALGNTLVPDADYSFDELGSVAWVANPQLFVSPQRSDLGLLDAMRLLATRGEGTALDSNANPEVRAVANEDTVECHLFQVRPSLDAEIATVEWLALSRGEFAVYVPSYAALLTQVDLALYPDADDGFDQAHVSGEDLEAQAMGPAQSGALTHVLMDLNTLASAHRGELGAGVHAYLNALQQELIDQQGKLDTQMQATASTEERTRLANEAHARASHEVFERCDALLADVRAYLAGGMEGEFAPSGLTGDGQLEEHLSFAEALSETQAEAAHTPEVAGASEATDVPETEAGSWRIALCCLGICVEVALALALRRLRSRL